MSENKRESKETLTLEEMEKGEKSTRSTRILKIFRRNLLIILLLVSLFLGITIGLAVHLSGQRFTDKEVSYISFPGTLFLNSLKMVIVPLIVSSLIAGMASLDQQASGKLGGKALLYYFSTTFIAVILGIIMVTSIQPGRGRNADDIDRAGSSQQVNTVDAFLDLLRNMVPPNIIAACFQTYKTREIEVEPMEMMDMMTTMATAANATMVMVTEGGNMMTMNDSMMSTMMPKKVYKSVGGFEDKSNILGLVVFSCFFGAIIGRMGPKGEPVKIFVNSFMEAIMKLVAVIIWLSPIGIFFLIIGKMFGMEDLAETLQQIGLYCVTVLAGLGFHAIINLPLLYFIFTRKNPFHFFVGVLPAITTAFATASSSATLPITLTSLEQNLKIDRRVTRFVLPIGATINMDGTALYEAVAAIFIAQVNGIPLDAKDVVTISITATLASIGAAGVPQAGLVTMVIVLNAVGLPIDDITLIIVIDWLLDRFRTAINVWGDSIGAGIIYERSKEDLKNLPDPFDDDSQSTFNNDNFDTKM